MADTLVFIPAWNEEANLPDVLEDLRAELADVDVLVVDDGSTDGTAAVAREHGAEVPRSEPTAGCRWGTPPGYRYARDHGYAFCGRVDADGQHPPAELARLLHDGARGTLRRGGRVALRLRRQVRAVPLHAARLAPGRHGGAPPAMALVLERPFGDATSGLVRGEREGDPAAGGAVRERGARGRSADPIVEAGLRLEDFP